MATVFQRQLKSLPPIIEWTAPDSTVTASLTESGDAIVIAFGPDYGYGRASATIPLEHLADAAAAVRAILADSSINLNPKGSA